MKLNNKEYQKGYNAGIKSVDYLIDKKTTPNIHIVAGLLQSIMNIVYFKANKKTIDGMVDFAQITAKRYNK